MNYMRTACVIAVTKAHEIFEPFLHQVEAAIGYTIRGYHKPSDKMEMCAAAIGDR